MAPSKSSSDQILTPLELQIMQALWKLGDCTVQSVQENLLIEPKLAYTTVQTMLNVLHRKGKVRRRLKGRAFEYRAVVTQEKATRYAVRDLVHRMFGGSAEGLLMALVDTRQISPKKIAELATKLDREDKEESEHE